jgi:hypothetical protein
MQRALAVVFVFIVLAVAVSTSRASGTAGSRIVPAIEQSGNSAVRFQIVIPSRAGFASDIVAGPDSAIGDGRNGGDSANIWIVQPCSVDRIQLAGPDQGAVTALPIAAVADCNLGFANLVRDPRAYGLNQPNMLLTSATNDLQFVVYGSGLIFEPFDGNNRLATPGAVTAAADDATGDPWFVGLDAQGAPIFGKMGTATAFSIPETPNSAALGMDGRFWLPLLSHNEIDRITTSGVQTLFALPSPAAEPYDIVAGTNDDLWFFDTVSGNPAIARITTSGTITQFVFAHRIFPGGFVLPGKTVRSLVVDEFDNAWFYSFADNFSMRSAPDQVVEISPDGSVTRYQAPGNGSECDDAVGTLGQDANLWFGITDGCKAPGSGDSFMAFVFLLDRLNLTPRSLAVSVGEHANFTVMETRYDGPWHIVNSNTNVAFAEPTDNVHVFRVRGIKAGTDVVTVFDRMGNSTQEVVSVP